MSEEKSEGRKREEYTTCTMHDIMRVLRCFVLVTIAAFAVLALASIFEVTRTLMVRATIVVVAGAFYTLWLWGQN